jgi:hypothetical protein
VFRRTIAAATAGSLLGAFLGIIALALGAARLVDAGTAVPELDSGALGAVVAVSQAGLYLFVAIAGAIAGAILAMFGYGIVAQADPASRRYRLGPIAALGAVIGAPVAFAVTRATVGAAGDIVANTVTLGVFRAGIVALVAGALTGGLVVVAMERLARPETLGLSGVAVPRSIGDFVRAGVAAVGLPVVGLAVGGALVFALSRVLLESDPTVALIVFGGVAAVVLFGTAFIAAHPPRRKP